MSGQRAGDRFVRRVFRVERWRVVVSYRRYHGHGHPVFEFEFRFGRLSRRVIAEREVRERKLYEDEFRAEQEGQTA